MDEMIWLRYIINEDVVKIQYKLLIKGQKTWFMIFIEVLGVFNNTNGITNN